MQNKSCIAVLTRGYSHEAHYENLVKRNQHIEINLLDKSIDILIFHEGNILDQHQEYIKSRSLSLKIKFINISAYAFKKEKSKINLGDFSNLGLGYRHMCSFWFVDFWNYVNDYEYLLRIDEDCFIDFKIDQILLELQNITFISGKTQDDAERVTFGLNKFSLNFLKQNNFNEEKWNVEKKPGGPYTNIIGFSLKKILEKEIFMKYIKEVDASEMIYKRRWGDMPLWGEAIFYLFGSETMKLDDRIKYYHQSHKVQIN